MLDGHAVRLALLTALFAFLLHAGFIAVKVETHPTHSLLAVFRVGGKWEHRPAFVAREGYPLEVDGYGTDGQQYLFIAHDPLARGDEMRAAIDWPRYRYGRILLPGLA